MCRWPGGRVARRSPNFLNVKNVKRGGGRKENLHPIKQRTTTRVRSPSGSATLAHEPTETGRHISPHQGGLKVMGRPSSISNGAIRRPPRLLSFAHTSRAKVPGGTTGWRVAAARSGGYGYRLSPRGRMATGKLIQTGSLQPRREWFGWLGGQNPSQNGYSQTRCSGSVRHHSACPK